MKLAIWCLPTCALALALTSCGSGGSKGSTASATPGPFDSRGNYIEEWADNPSKWRKPGSAPSPHELKTDELPIIASNDQPPQNSIPLAPRGGGSTSIRPTPPAISQTVVASRSKPATSGSQTVVSVRKTPTPERQSETVVVRAKPKVTESKSTASRSTKAKTVAKTKAKVKPKSVRYTVKKGDSLSAIASRNGTSVSALKSANGISGSTIRPGQSLSIPK